MLLVAVFLLVLIGVVAPFVNAARFSGSIRNALESSLGRKVQFEKAYFTLFSGPGFSLENVTISEDPRYGIEPFAYVPTLQARVRLDKLLRGQIRFTSLRLVGPSLNLVKRSDGTWNVVQLMGRLSAPRRAPLNLFPSFEVSGGRVDFKFGVRKTTLYISESDLTVYPERSGKVYIQFSGSPARTDRAGIGFGHFRGNVNWILSAPGNRNNQLDANVTLDPSNLSELVTLVEGHDVGVHGTVSSSLRMAGRIDALKVTGQLRLDDVHRWDLLPSSGEEWAVRYAGDLDLVTHRFDLKTVPSRAGQATPVAIRILINNFLSQPTCSVVADLKNAPLEALLPLALRMGVPLPNGAKVSGTLDGAIGYSSDAGWAGGLRISKAAATLPAAPALETAAAEVTISGNRIHFEPTDAQAGTRSTITLGGDYFIAAQQTQVSLSAQDIPISDLKPTINAWFGEPSALAAFRNGDVTGEFSYSASGTARTPSGNPEPPSWSGHFDFAGSVIAVPGLASTLQHARGRVKFNNSTFDVDHLNATVGRQSLRASYRYNSLAKRPERVHVELPATDLLDLESALQPALRPAGLWARLRFTRRSVPSWLSSRDVEGDLIVEHLFIGGKPLGSLDSHFVWQGTTVEIPSLTITLPQGGINARGAVSLVSDTPQYRFAAKMSGFEWKGGSLDAESEFQTSGIGVEALQNLKAAGSFSGEGIALSPSDTFDKVSGLFQLSFADNWPNLRLSNIQALEDQDDWSGEGFSQSDGKLLLDLAHAGKQVRIVSSLLGENAPDSSPPLAHDPGR